jgi:hypothetical protein
MKITEENDQEIYIDIQQDDLPLTIESPGKNPYVRVVRPDDDISGLGLPIPRIWKSKEELLKEFPQ